MISETKSLVEALELEAAGSLVSIVGGGGKSALLFALAERLPGRVVTTTTTRIFAEQISRANESAIASGDELAAAIARKVSGLLVIGEVDGEKALGVPPELPGELLRDPAVDYVVVEADGSRMRPIKAPAAHEPVVPVDSDLVVIAVGLDALSSPMGEIAHRPERITELIGVRPDQHLEPRDVAQLLRHAEGGLKNVPAHARAIALLNKVESPAEADIAAEIAEAVLAEPRFSRVVVGALEGREPDRWTVYRPGSR